LVDKSLTPHQQLLMLRDMTERFETMHEAQVLQIKLWPLAVDPGLTQSVANIDIKGKSLTYTWERPAWNPDRGYQKRLRGLADAIETYFGPTWHLKIIQNGGVLPIPAKTQGQSPNRRKNVRKGRKRSAGHSRKGRR
jgi:hypothetical protein